jgi:hypothetical protein
VKWSNGKSFISYTTCMGRDLLYKRLPVPNVIECNWRGVLSPTFTLEWKKLWDTDRANKEAGLIWQAWHKAIVVNEWHQRIAPTSTLIA